MRRIAVIVAAVAAGFVVPAVAAYVWLRHVWPPQRDLSDIGTSLMRDGAAFVVGLIGAAIAFLLARRRR